MPLDDVLGVVLAGGASRRMGRDKARLEIAGLSGDPVALAEHAARRLATVCAEVVLADGGRRVAPGRRSIADGPGAGPAAGILGAAAFRPGRDLLVLACDLPLAPIELLETLAGRRIDNLAGHGGVLEARIPHWRRGVEPLCALYTPSALECLARQVEDGRFALHRWLEKLDAHYLEAEELARFGPPEKLFLNLNRPADLDRFRTGSERLPGGPGAAAGSGRR